jgi:hypothetical protein
MRNLSRLAFVVLLSVLASQQIDAQYLHPKITEKKVTIHNAVILPAKVELTKASAKGNEMMVEESAQASESVFLAVGQSLQAKQISVLKSPFDKPEVETLDQERKYTLANIQSLYDALLPKLLDKSKDVKKGRFSLGDEVSVLGVDKSADVLIFIRGQGRVFTKGKTAFSLLNPFSFDYPILLITVGIVDVHSGEVLVFTKPLSASKILNNPRELNKLITKSLKKLPAAS